MCRRWRLVAQWDGMQCNSTECLVCSSNAWHVLVHSQHTTAHCPESMQNNAFHFGSPRIWLDLNCKYKSNKFLTLNSIRIVCQQFSMKTYFNFNGNMHSTRNPLDKSNIPIWTFGLSSPRHETKPYARLSFIGSNANDSTRALLPNMNRSVCFSFTTPDNHFHEIMLPALVQPYSNFGAFGSHCWPTIFLPLIPSNSRIHSPVDVLYARIFVSHIMNKMLRKSTERNQFRYERRENHLLTRHLVKIQADIQSHCHQLFVAA